MKSKVSYSLVRIAQLGKSLHSLTVIFVLSQFIGLHSQILLSILRTEKLKLTFSWNFRPQEAKGGMGNKNKGAQRYDQWSLTAFWYFKNFD